MKNPIIFLNTGWMDFYKGVGSDLIFGGGKHVRNEGWGGEMFNFKKLGSKFYGYVQPIINRSSPTPSQIKIEKLGAGKMDQYLKNVTVVWTASDPINGGTYIVGWYLKATIFRFQQDPPKNSNRNYGEYDFGYFVTAGAKDSVLLNQDQRIVHIERRKKNWMGQSNVWYADENPEFIKLVKNYIFKNKIPTTPKRGSPRQNDQLKRIEVEKAAIKTVVNHYQKLGYQVDSVEKDNVGWDLTARNSRLTLKLEVKGLSGQNLIAELTPNEYKNLSSDLSNYRLCIVINALKRNSSLNIFFYSRETQNWIDETGRILNFEEKVSARVYI